MPSTKAHGFKSQESITRPCLPAVVHMSSGQHTSTVKAPSPPDWHRQQPAACRECSAIRCCQGMPLTLVHCRMNPPDAQWGGSMPRMAAAACSSTHAHMVHGTAASMAADACSPEQGTSCGFRRNHYMQSKAGHHIKCCLQV